MRKIETLLLGIGAMKAGTTWLYAHRWYADFLMNVDPKWWYPRVFDHRDDEAICADFSNLNAQLDEKGWEHVKKTANNVKVLFCMRNPVERLWSHMRFHNVQAGLNMDLQKMTTSELEKYASGQHFQWPGQYSQTIKTLRNSLNPEDYKLAFHETIHADQKTFLSSIETFLNIAHIDYPEKSLASRVNSSSQQTIPEKFKISMQNKFEAEIDTLAGLGLDVPESWLLKAPI